MNDPVIDEMAEEMAEALRAKGLDLTMPPSGKPPADGIFREYQARRGENPDKDDVAAKLVQRVTELGQEEAA